MLCENAGYPSSKPPLISGDKTPLTTLYRKEVLQAEY